MFCFPPVMLSWFGCTVASQASRSLSATSSHKLLPTDFLQPCNHFHSTLFAIFNRPFCHFYSILLPFSLSLFAVFTQPFCRFHSAPFCRLRLFQICWYHERKFWSWISGKISNEGEQFFRKFIHFGKQRLTWYPSHFQSVRINFLDHYNSCWVTGQSPPNSFMQMYLNLSWTTGSFNPFYNFYFFPALICFLFFVRFFSQSNLHLACSWIPCWESFGPKKWQNYVSMRHIKCP